MNLPKPIEINLFDFIQSGKFDCIKLGQTKEWILNNFPDPEGFDEEVLRKNGFDIWCYGNIEFHFKNNELFLIYADDLELSGGENLIIDKWIFEDYNKLNLLYVLMKLNEYNISYKKTEIAGGVTLRLQSGVELTFSNIHDDENISANEFMITSLGLVAENLRVWK